MGAAIGNGGLKGPRAGRRYRPLAEINVTPFVDVMLVLLVIFMITAPLLTVGVPVDLPETLAQAMREDKEPLAITLKADGKIYLEDTEVQFAELVPRLSAIAETGYDERIFVRADQTVPSGRLLEVMGELNAAGYRKVGLITAPARRPPGGSP